MYASKYDVLELIMAIAMYLIPVVVIAIRRNLLWQFKFSSLIKVLNFAFVIQLIGGVVLSIAGFIVDRNIDGSNGLNGFTEIFEGTVYFFLVIGMMLYVPILIILNIINWFKIRSSKIVN